MGSGQSSTHINNRLIMIAVFSLLLFFAILVNLLADGPLLDVVLWVSTHIPEIQSGTLTEMVIFITNINGVVGATVFSLLVVLFLGYKKYYLDLKFYLLAFLGGSALFTVIKLLIERARPALKIINEQGYSFPSGHATMSMAISMALYFIFIDKITSLAGRRILLFVCLFWPLLIASTRVYLNVHWLSDTIAGFALGLFWVTLLRLEGPFSISFRP